MARFIPVVFMLCAYLFTFTKVKAQCSTEEFIPVISFETNSTIITVDGLVNDDLSSNSQGLCGVYVRMKHAQIGELELKLKSPIGQEISLIGPQGSFGLTSNTNWAITFLPDAFPVSPDAGFSEKWDSDQPWGVFGNYTGTYHPSNSPLESFNAGSANGDWVVTASDGFQFDDGAIEEVILFFCDTEGLSCNPCLADPGEFPISEITTCVTELNNVLLEPTFPNGEPNENYDYYYIVRQEENILSIEDDLNVSNLLPGDYAICGLSLKKEFESQIPFYLDFNYSQLQELIDTSSVICGKLDTQCVALYVIPELEDIEIDTSLCLGQILVIENDTLDSEGYFEIIKDRGDSCAQKYNVNLDYVELEGNLNASSLELNCTDLSILIDARESSFGTHTNISWETPNGNIVEYVNDTIIRVNQPGLYVLNLEQGGCNYSSNINITAEDDFPDLSFFADSLNCQNGSTKIDLISNVELQSISWTGPNGFESSIDNPVVNTPGIYEVTVVSDAGCQTSAQVEIFQIASSFDVILSADSLNCLVQNTVISDSSSVNLFSYNWTGPNGFTFEGPNPEVFELGVYTLLAQDSFGCEKMYDIEIGGNLDSFDFELHINDINCPNEFVEIAVSYEVVEPFIEWSGPDKPYGMDSIISVNKVGDYSVELSANGCTVSSSFSIEDNFDRLPVAEPFQLDSLSCTNQSTILFANITENAGNVLKHQWIGPENFSSSLLNPSVSQLGTYTLIITTINNCELLFFYDVFISNNFPIVDIDTLSINCAQDFGEITLELNNYNDSIYVTGPNGYGSGELIHTNLIAGDYTVEVFDSAGCKSEFIVPIKADTVASKAEILSSNLLDCSNTDLKLFTKNIYNNYIWYNSSGILANTDTLIVNTPQIIFLEALGGNQCIVRDTFEVESSDDNINIVDIIDKTLDCQISNTSLEVYADKTIAKYNWTGPDGFQSTSSQPIVYVPGVYEVLITGNNGCLASGQLIVDLDTVKPNIMTEYDHALTCLLTNATLSGGSTTNDVSYLWEGPLGFQSVMPAVLVNEPGNYLFTVTGNNHCKSTAEIILPFEGVFAKTEVTNDTVFCKDNLPNVLVDSDIPDVQYSWSGPGGFTSNIANPTVNNAGKYYVSVTTNEGCVTVDSATVTFKNNLPNLSLINQIDTLNCQLKEVFIDLDVDISTNNIEWNGPNGFSANTLDVNVTEAGKYEVVVEGYNNCINKLELEVGQDTILPKVELTVDTLTCYSPNVKINVQTVHNIESMSWDGPNDYTSNLQDQIDVFEKGVYYVTITGGNYCIGYDSIDVLEDFAEPEVFVTNDTLNCDYDMLTLGLMDPSNTNTYLWDGPNAFSSLLQNPMTNTAGLYSVIVTGSNGCTSENSLEIFDLNYYPEIACSKSGDISCIIKQVELVGSDISEGEIRRWEGPDLINETNASIQVNQPGIYKYIVEGFTGCISEKIIEVIGDTIPPVLMINQIGQVRCEYDSVEINAEGSSIGEEYNYSWVAVQGKIFEGEETPNPTISGLGKYVLTIQNELNGCISKDSISIEEQFSTLLGFEMTVKNISCHKDSLGAIFIDQVIGGFKPYKFAREGYSFDTIREFNQLEKGKYLIAVKDSFGCLYEESFIIEKEPLFNVDLGQDVKIKLGDEVDIKGETTLDNAEIDSIIWIPTNIVDCESCLEFNFEPSENTKIILKIVDINGCENSDEKIILVDDEVEIYVPNIFSPNGDNVNDELSVSKSKMVEKVQSFVIYDRWGSIMHEDYNFLPGEGRPWDGKHLGLPVVNGVYPYVLQMKLKNGKSLWKKGTITVVK